jgi:ATP-dependent DNA helicase RecG
MTEETFKDICLCGETTTVQFKEIFTSQKEIAKEMIAFANTKGGTILFGVEDKTGGLVGLTYEQIQQTSRELGNAAQEQVRPTIYIETEVVCADNKHFLVCTVNEGRNKPYKNLQGEIWVKQGADKRRITENAEILGLFQSSGLYHPEEDVEKGSSVDDLEMVYIRDYFKKVYGREIEEFDQSLDSMLRSLGVLTASGEVTRVGMLFFGKNPQQYERSIVLKAVTFAGNDIGDTNYLDSRDITGTLPWMFKEGMAFLKSYLRHEQKGQNFNSVGIIEIPEVVLEELLQNALVHFDLLNHAAIRLLIFNDRIEIVNPGCLYGGLKVDDIKLGISRQRNPLMADFAAKTMIYRGLGSGIVRVMREDSHIDFDNEESANQFKVTVWRTIQKNASTIQKNGFTIQKEGLKDNDTTQKKESTTQKDGLMDSDTIQKSKSTIQKDESTIQKNLDTTQKRVLEYFSAHPHSTIDEAVVAIDNLSLGGIKFIIGKLQQKGLLKRVGGRKQGEWKVLV